MTEDTLEDKCVATLEALLLPQCLVLKHSDKVTAGLPDRSVNYHHATSWLEFKYLRKRKTIHDAIKNARQLITCAQLENTTGRCWFVAYTWDKRTLVYRPTKLLQGREPQPEGFEPILTRDALDKLWHRGVIQIAGHAHGDIVRLIQFTHVPQPQIP